MHLGLDGKRLLHNRSGLGNYSRSMVRALALHQRDLNISILAPKGKEQWQNEICLNGFDKPSEFKNLNLSVPSFAPPWWRSKGMGSMATRLGVDVFHGLSNEIPIDLPKHVRKICTIHDLIFLDHPAGYPWLDRKTYTMKVRYALDHADAIIATSQETKERILFHFPNAKAPIHVVYQPIHPAFKNSESNSASSDAPYFIYHSSFNSRKNHLRLLQAFESIASNINHNLVLVGIKGDTYDAVCDYVTKDNLHNRVKIMTDVSTIVLVDLLRKADGFVYPSISEGFGIPLAEAAACGLNAAVSDIAVFNELSDGKMIGFNPLETASIASAIMKLANRDQTSNANQAAARKKIMQLVDEKHITDQLMAIYSNAS